MLFKPEKHPKDVRLMEKLGWWSVVVFVVLGVLLAWAGYYYSTHGTRMEGPDTRMDAVVPAGR